MRRARLWIALVVVSFLATVAGVWLASRNNDRSETFEPVSEFDLVEVGFDNGIYGVSFDLVEFGLLVVIIVVAAVLVRHARRRRRASSPATEPRE